MPDNDEINVADAFTPFDSDEVARMRLYVDQTRSVAEHPFWKADLSLEMQGGTDPPFSSRR